MPASIAAAISRASDGGLVVVVGEPCDADAAAGWADGDERLRAAAGVVADAARRGVEDLRAAAVVAAQHELRARTGTCGGTRAGSRRRRRASGTAAGRRRRRRRASRPARRRPGPARRASSTNCAVVGVLELVDDDVPPAAPVARPHDRVAREQLDAVDDEVVEVERVRRAQLAIDGVPDRRDPLALRMLGVDAHRVGRPQPAFARSDLRERARRPRRTRRAAARRRRGGRG